MLMHFVAGLIGGVLLLLAGVSMMSSGLKRLGTERLKATLDALAGSVPRAVLASTVLTALCQSSSAVTVLAVGLVDSGAMSLTQAVGVVYGANIGTTVTAHIMTLNIGEYALPVLFTGILLRVVPGGERVRHLGETLAGVGFMFTGLGLLNSGVPLLETHPVYRQILITLGRAPLSSVLAGMLGTMLVHSSSATVGMSIVLARAGLIDLGGAICLMLGDNIGTCITAQIASVGRGASARRTAWSHTLYNVLGVALVLIVLPAFISLARATSADIARQVANSHTLFNLLSALIFVPLTPHYVKLIEMLVPERPKRLCARRRRDHPRPPSFPAT